MTKNDILKTDYRNLDTLQDSAFWLDKNYSTQEDAPEQKTTTGESGGLFDKLSGVNWDGTITNVLGYIDKGVDIKNKLDAGKVTVKGDGFELDVSEGTEKKEDMKKWYIGGAVLILLIGGGLWYVSKDNK